MQREMAGEAISQHVRSAKTSTNGRRTHPAHQRQCVVHRGLQHLVPQARTNEVLGVMLLRRRSNVRINTRHSEWAAGSINSPLAYGSTTVVGAMSYRSS